MRSIGRARAAPRRPLPAGNRAPGPRLTPTAGSLKSAARDLAVHCVVSIIGHFAEIASKFCWAAAVSVRERRGWQRGRLCGGADMMPGGYKRDAEHGQAGYMAGSMRAAQRTLTRCAAAQACRAAGTGTPLSLARYHFRAARRGRKKTASQMRSGKIRSHECRLPRLFHPPRWQGGALQPLAAVPWRPKGGGMTSAD